MLANACEFGGLAGLDAGGELIGVPVEHLLELSVVVTHVASLAPGRYRGTQSPGALAIRRLLVSDGVEVAKTCSPCVIRVPTSRQRLLFSYRDSYESRVIVIRSWGALKRIGISKTEVKVGCAPGSNEQLPIR